MFISQPDEHMYIGRPMEESTLLIDASSRRKHAWQLYQKEKNKSI